jgi:hypothetical protein
VSVASRRVASRVARHAPGASIARVID